MSEGTLDGKVIGEIGVSVAVEHLLRAGFSVAIPVVDDGYDLLACSGRTCWRIQVKATNAIGSRSGSRVRLRKGRNKTLRYTSSEVDAVIAVHVGKRSAICVPFSRCQHLSCLHFASHSQFTDFGILRSIKPNTR